MSQTDRNVGILFVRVESAPIDLLSRGSNTATSLARQQQGYRQVLPGAFL